MLRAYGRLLLFSCVVASVSCGPTVDLTKGITINVLKTGWWDAGIVNGQNKLVPSITFTLTNVSDQRLKMLQVNSLFRRVSEPDEWGSSLVTVAGSDGLPPGATTEPLTVKSNLGYTGSDQTRQE